MRILIVCARFPELAGKGDQQRAFQFARLLSARHEVRVATAGRPSSEPARTALAAVATVVPLRVTALERLAGAALAPLTGLPIQIGWMSPPPAHRQIAAAAGSADIAIAVTIRCLPRQLPVPTVLDHIDALSANMSQRTQLERGRLRRGAANLEARLLARHERRAAGWVFAQTAVSPLDAAALPAVPAPRVIPLVVELGAGAPQGAGTASGSADSSERDIDVILTGDMRYPPNRDAAEWLAEEIAPALRRRCPHARVVVAGRGADTLAPHAGLELMSDVPDIGALLHRAKVAAVPLRHGTGTPIKLHEAAVHGAAPIATAWVADALGADVETADDAAAFAAAIARLLADDELRRRRVEAARESLSRSSAAAVTAQLDALLAAVKDL